ncbi:ATP-binding cassette domain-containing protein [Klebsiella michiganensis]|nr:ATP-binding cassette domain-containing protein [Klebsiella michiganensis]
MHREAREKLDRINADIDPQAPLGSLSIGRQQMVEIARAVSENAKVLVLDEPTAALSRAETLQLYRLIEQMRQDGVGMVYISHRMEEVWQLANRVTVFRDGTWIGTEILGNVSTTDIVRMMVGTGKSSIFISTSRVRPARYCWKSGTWQAVRPARSPLRSTRAKW